MSPSDGDTLEESVEASEIGAGLDSIPASSNDEIIIKSSKNFK